MRSGNGKGTGGIARIIGILVVIYILTSMFSGGDGGLVSLLFRLLGFFFWGGFLLLVLCLAITAAVIYFTVRDNKYRKPHDPPGVTPPAARKKEAGGSDPQKNDGNGQMNNTGQGKAGGDDPGSSHRQEQKAPVNYPVADRSKVYEKTPEGIMQMLNDYRIDYILGAVASDACRQKERLTRQQESYRRLVERRFGRGTLSAENISAWRRAPTRQCRILSCGLLTAWRLSTRGSTCISGAALINTTRSRTMYRSSASRYMKKISVS